MQCKCGFTNVASAKFCGSCGLPLADWPGSTVPDAAVRSPATSVRKADGNAGGRRLSRMGVAIVAVVVAVAATGYWWLNRPPGPYTSDNSGLYPIVVDGKYGYMDRAGKTVITPQFDAAGGFSEGLAAVLIGTKVGYVNTKGAVVITPQFEGILEGRLTFELMGFRYGRACVLLGSGYGFINEDGKYIHSPDFVWAGSFSGDLAPVKTAAGEAAFLDRSGKVVMSGKFEGLGAFTAGLAPARSGGKWGYIGAAGEWVIDPQFEEAQNFADGLALVVVGGRVGYIDRNGKFVVNPQYDGGFELVFKGSGFNEGYASVKSGGAFSFIDATGRVLGDTKFAAVGYFADGLAPVKTNDGWGFIDTPGKMVISPQFDSADSFQNGLAHVQAIGKEAYITTSGAFVVDPFPGTTIKQEKARLAVIQQAERDAQADQPQEPVDLSRFAGQWVGLYKGDENARLTITIGTHGSTFDAVLDHNGWRESLRGDLLDVHKAGFRGASKTGFGSVASKDDLLAVEVELDSDRGALTGSYRDIAGNTAFILMTIDRP